MGQRTYTPEELDALRLAADNKFLWGSYDGARLRGEVSRMYHAEDKSSAVEWMVAEFIEAGRTAEELRAGEDREARR